MNKKLLVLVIGVISIIIVGVSCFSFEIKPNDVNISVLAYEPNGGLYVGDAIVVFGHPPSTGWNDARIKTYDSGVGEIIGVMGYEGYNQWAITYRETGYSTAVVIYIW